MEQNTETWRPCVSRGEAIVSYEVSDAGAVRRCLPGHRTEAGRVLAHKYDSEGYDRMVLMHGGKRVGRRVHQLVAEAFIGPRPPGMVVNHIDADKTNNSACNLEYVTQGQNITHAIETGRLNPSLMGGAGRHRRPARRLTDGEVQEIRAVAGREGVGQTAKRIGCSTDTVNDIQRGKTHRRRLPA